MFLYGTGYFVESHISFLLNSKYQSSFLENDSAFLDPILIKNIQSTNSDSLKSQIMSSTFETLYSYKYHPVPSPWAILFNYSEFRPVIPAREIFVSPKDIKSYVVWGSLTFNIDETYILGLDKS